MKNKGFTLLELVISILVFSIVSTVVYSSFKNEIMAYMNQKKFSEMISQLRTVSYFISNDLKTVGFDPIDAPDVKIEIAEKDFFSFVRINDDFKTPDDLKRVALYKCGDRILRYAANTDSGFNWGMPELSVLCSSASFKGRIPEELAGNVSELKLVYLDKKGNSISQTGLDNRDKNLTSEIRSVEVMIKSQIDYWGKSSKSECFKFLVQCRNLGI